jgi:hypothetical protein
MPISIRKLGSTFSAASYRFPDAQSKDTPEEWPWLLARASHIDLCATCSQLNFRWLFRESLAGYTVSDGTSSSLMSDGICLGLHSELSSRSNCEFCQLIIYALEEGADIDMMNSFDEWPSQEIWLRNHAVSQSGKVVNFADLTGEYIIRLDLRLDGNRDDNVIFSSGGFGGCTIAIQEIHDCPLTSQAQSREGRAVDIDTKGLVETIRRWIEPCFDGEVAFAKVHNQSDAEIRLIDTRNECIVGPMRHERYVALRYHSTRLTRLN